MQLPSYPILEVSRSQSVYRFLSVGPSGTIPKLIVFSEYSASNNVFVLSLIDLIDKKDASDTHLSNNGDIYKLLATVAQTVIDYTSIFPERTIYFAGNDGSGKRATIYNAAIKRFYLELDFEIEGILNELFKEPFHPLGSYQGFLVKRK